MEIKFTEFDNIISQNPYEQSNNNDYVLDNNSDKYWENTKSKNDQTKKKKVSFNDILSNMNLVVDKKGVLVSMRPAQKIETQQQNYHYEEQYVPQNQYQRQDQPQKYQPQKHQPQKHQPQQQEHQHQQPIDPSVKHSYVYNKYFKDYADISAPIPEKKVPKTIEEYNQMVMEERIQRLEEKKRISAIKSTKLMFTTTPNDNIIQRNPRNIQPSKNNLRKMSFW
jgi:hypothetical protein